MSELSNLLDLINRPTAQVFRRLYMKRLVAASGQHESDWQEIDEARVLSWGAIESDAGGNISLYQDKFPRMTFELDNKDGYFNDVDSDNSFFDGYYTRYRTRVKVEAGYMETDGTEYPTTPQVFEGFVDEDIAQGTDGRKLTLHASGMEQILKDYSMEDLDPKAFPDTTTTDITGWHVIRYIQYDSGTSGLVRHHFSLDSWIVDDLISHGLGKSDLDTASVADLNCWEFLQQLAVANNMHLTVTPRGQLYIARYEVDSVIDEMTGSVSDTDCIFHASLDDTVGCEIKETGNNLTCTSAHPLYNAGYFNNGFQSELTDTSHLEYNSNDFNPQRFCIQFWYQPVGFDISGGAAPESISVMEVTITTVETGVFDTLKIGFGTIDEYTLGTALTIGKKKTNYQPSDLFGTGVGGNYCAVTGGSGVNLTAGSNGFFAFVYDYAGIQGTRDLYRIYFAHEDDSAPTLVASDTLAAWDVAMTTMGGLSASCLFHFLPLSAGSATGPAIIDDIKIYTYAKTDFTDFKTSAEYFKRKKFRIQGPADSTGSDAVNIIGDIEYRKAIDNIYNDITINYSGGSANAADSTPYAVSSSSHMYGLRPFEMDIMFLDAVVAGYAATDIKGRYEDAHDEISCRVKLMPFINLLDRLQVTYQSPIDHYTNQSFYNENFNSYADGTSLIGAGDQEYTVRTESNTGTAVATDSALNLLDSGDQWVCITCNDSDLAAKTDGVLEFDIPAYAGGRVGVTYHHTSDGGYYVQLLPGSELRIHEFNAWDILTGMSVTANWDSQAPSTVSSMKLSLSSDGTEMKLYIDGEEINTYTGTTHSVGTFGFAVFGAGGLTVDNVSFEGPTAACRQIDIDDVQFEVIKMSHDLDNLETKLTLREVL